MRIFQNKWFERFASKERISERLLCEAVRRAECGLIDADLGGGVIKQRVPRVGQGRSGGFRLIILYRAEGRAFLVYGYAKSEREDVTTEEVTAFRLLANEVLNYDAEMLASSLSAGIFEEVKYDEQVL